MDRLKQFLLTNTSAKQTVAKNTFWLVFGELVGRVFKLLIVVYTTRRLGVEGWGVFSYGLAFVSLFYIFADTGINLFVTKECSGTSPERYRVVAGAFVFKMIILFISFVTALLVVPRFGNVLLPLSVVISIAILNFSDSLREFILSINRAYELMEREAIVKIVMNAALTLVGLVALFLYPSPSSLALAYAIGSVIATLVAWRLLPISLSEIPWRDGYKDFRPVISFAWPFLAMTVFSAALVTLDSIMLGQMKSVKEVGIYAAAQRIPQFLAIIPVFISTALFPTIARREAEGADSIAIFERMMVLVLMIALPLAVGGLFLSGKLMTIIYGSSFTRGGVVLAVLMGIILADFPFLILGNMITLKGLQKKFIFSTIIGLAINIALNLLLIPRFGALGAAISISFAQILIMTINWITLKRYISFNVIPKLGVIAIGTVAMACVLGLCASFQVYFLVTITLGVCSYLGVLILLREPSINQILSVIHLHEDN